MREPGGRLVGVPAQQIPHSTDEAHTGISVQLVTAECNSCRPGKRTDRPAVFLTD